MTAENRYEPREIEARWQGRWEEESAFRASNPGDADFDPARPKYYVLDMFPYPSGSGLHVGHALGYVATDAIARRKRMQGFNVLHPMGWDAFGLPAEQYAIQTGKHPAETTEENTANYRAQLKRIGMSYDWSREINTSSPNYYRWTQRLFGVLFEAGLAYQAEVPVWWCEELKTVLANEEVINGRSERGNHPCERRPLKQWMLKITTFADRLLADLEGIDWPESIKIQQREWIGRSEGADVDFTVEQLGGEVLTVFTTRPDTLFGATFLVLAPEHPLLAGLVGDAEHAAVDEYVRQAAAKSDLERTDLALDKSGVFTGAFALNPLLDADDPRARLPIWVADYVLMGYGTGAIMAVPGHDQRDFEFARCHDLPVVEVVHPPAGTPGVADGACFAGEGTAMNSGPLDGLATLEAVARAIELLGEDGTGRARVTYRLRDWLFSRQRYWGEPFPLLHHEDGSITLVPEQDLPLELPVMEDFAPASDGSAPLARDAEWVRTTDPVSGEPVRRDTDTMPGWAGSCWYWLRFMDPQNDAEPFSKEAEAYWGPVDLYVGGAAPRRHAPALRALLAQGLPRRGSGLHQRAIPGPFQPGDDPGLRLPGRRRASRRVGRGRDARRPALPCRQHRGAHPGRHEDGEVLEERRQPRRHHRRVRRRHLSPVRDVHGTARGLQALEPARHPRLPALPRPRLAHARRSG